MGGRIGMIERMLFKLRGSMPPVSDEFQSPSDRRLLQDEDDLCLLWISEEIVRDKASGRPRWCRRDGKVREMVNLR